MAAEEVVLVCVWGDLNSNHCMTTTKYCTPSADCNVWHCACDRNVRSRQAHKPLLGIVCTITPETEFLYFLPLAPCLGGESFASFSVSLP